MLDDFERACATPNMTFSQRKTVLALSAAACLSVTHLEHWSKQTRPPSILHARRASERAPPVKPFVKSSASPLPLSLPASADWTYSQGIMRTAENIQGDSHVYEPTLLSRLRKDFSGSPPQHKMH